MALDSAPTTGMAGILAKQKAAHIRDGIPSAAKRTEWLDKAIGLGRHRVLRSGRFSTERCSP